MIGFLDLEKGFLYTLKSLFTRPGHFVREYIDGKRLTYFHFLTFLLLILGIYIFLDEFSNVKLSQLYASSSSENNLLQDYESFSKKYPRLLTLIAIPLTSVITYFLFKKAKYNFAEHIILNTFKSSGELVIVMLFTVLTIFYTNIEVLKPIYSILQVILGIYFVYFFFQYFSPQYKSKWKLFFRILFGYVTLQLFIGIIVALALGIVKGYHSQI